MNDLNEMACAALNNAEVAKQRLLEMAQAVIAKEPEDAFRYLELWKIQENAVQQIETAFRNMGLDTIPQPIPHA